MDHKFDNDIVLIYFWKYFINDAGNFKVDKFLRELSYPAWTYVP